MAFELTRQPAQLCAVTPRIEKHGDESVQAVSLGLRITAPNTLLDVLSPGLMAQLYKPVEEGAPGQQQIEGTEITAMPLLRTRFIEKLQLKGELVGWSITIDYGIDDTSAITMSECKVDKFRVEPHEGGSVDLFLRVGTSDLDEDSAGRLMMLLGSEITVTLQAPQRKQEPIDGSTEAFERETREQDATDLFVNEHAEG